MFCVKLLLTRKCWSAVFFVCCVNHLLTSKKLNAFSLCEIQAMRICEYVLVVLKSQQYVSELLFDIVKKQQYVALRVVLAVFETVNRPAVHLNLCVPGVSMCAVVNEQKR